MEFKTLTKADCEQVRQWRNDCLYALRTPYGLTEEMQSRFYEDVICNRNTRARFWGIYIDDVVAMNAISGDTISDSMLIGMAGLENIEWENGTAEISLILNSDYRGKGCGSRAVDILLDKGFNNMGLRTIYGECYYCNPAIYFWRKIINRYGGYETILPKRKLWNGEYYGSLYFSIDKEDYNVRDNT